MGRTPLRCTNPPLSDSNKAMTKAIGRIREEEQIRRGTPNFSPRTRSNGLPHEERNLICEDVDLDLLSLLLKWE
jgi:hypothetical protein